MPKSDLEWSTKEDKQSSNNWKALNAIFNRVSPTQLKSISATKSTKEAWDVLQIEFEGTSVMQKSMIKLLTSKFNNVWMEENETVGQYHAIINDISNESFILGEKSPEEKLIRKFLRTLIERFDYKATPIIEAKNLETKKLEDLDFFEPLRWNLKKIIN